MAPAQTEKTEISIKLSNRKEQLVAKGEILAFDGFMKVYGGIKDDTLLPPVTVGQKLDLSTITATETFSRPPARYSEAALVKKLEELGIGRPSTYAPTISTIQARDYVEKRDLEGRERTVQTLTLLSGAITEEETTEITGADRNKLVPTHLAEVVTDFLVKYFHAVIDYDFTATVESRFDRVAEGEEQWEAMIGDFYKDFHPLVDAAGGVSRSEASQARELGIDPKTKKPIVARFGRFGPMLQRGSTEDEEKPTFAPMPAGVRLEEVTLEQALEMFKLPRLVGKTEAGEEIKANIGPVWPVHSNRQAVCEHQASRPI
jgi:DNA topoisomerase-1